MDEVLRTGDREWRKTGHGVFEVPLADLGDLHFVDVPFYSTVEIIGLSSKSDSYRLSISATHGGGPHNEDFHVFVHVGFWQPGAANDPITRTACDRRLGRIRHYFRGFVDSGLFTDGDGDEQRTRTEGSWLCSILYSRGFRREDNPHLARTVRPVVDRFNELLAAPDLLLFICHASEDKEFVDRLAVHLDSRAVSLWYDRREIKVGDSIVARISEGLKAASHLVIVLSKASVGKPWVKKEFSSALMNQLRDESIRIAPILREDCSIPALLSDVKYADCRTDTQAGFRQLVEDILGSPGLEPAA